MQQINSRVQALKDITVGKRSLSSLSEFKSTSIIKHIPYDESTDEQKENYREIKHSIFKNLKGYDEKQVKGWKEFFQFVPDATQDDLDRISKKEAENKAQLKDRVSGACT